VKKCCNEDDAQGQAAHKIRSESIAIRAENNKRLLASFHPQMVFLPNLCVNLRACLCGVVNYASAQALDFLDLGQKSAFLDWKHQYVPIFGKDLLWMGTS
jgi:hypothetical protein